MKQYISEGRAMYEDENHGLFSKKLAEWAISKMKTKDPETKQMKSVRMRSVDDIKSVLKEAFTTYLGYDWTEIDA